MTFSSTDQGTARSFRFELPVWARLPILAGAAALFVAETLAERTQEGASATAQIAPGATWPEFATQVLGNFSLSFLIVVMLVLLCGSVAPRHRRVFRLPALGQRNQGKRPPPEDGEELGAAIHGTLDRS